MTAKLVILSEGLTGTSYELKADRTTIGRLDDNSFTIAEPSVSSRHCEVLLKGTEVTIKDLGSTNGTFINGERITEGKLKPGGILKLGQIEIRLEVAGESGEKKKLDQTMVISQGVKRGDLEQGGRSVNFDKNSPFTKRKDKAKTIFIVVSVVLALVIVAILAVAFINSSGGE